MTSQRSQREELVDYYAVLEISKDATDEDVKRAYRRQALRWHPDKNNGIPDAEQRFKLVAEAYEILRDPRERRAYNDRLLKYITCSYSTRIIYLHSGDRQQQQQQQQQQRQRHWQPNAFHFHNPFEIFAEFFGNGDNRGYPFSGFNSGIFANDPFANDPFFQSFPSSSMRSGPTFFGDNPVASNVASLFNQRAFNSGGSGGGRSTFTEIKIVNGERTETTTVSDGQGNTRTETTFPDGSKRLLINGGTIPYLYLY
jgi:curved DNA-binding protein CbpA